MIITVTLNAAIDRTLDVPNFRLGRRHRSVEQTTLPGGKGVNIARALKRLDQPVIATGFVGGQTGTRIVEGLISESVPNDFVRIADESRTNTAIVEPTTGEQTEVNEPGPHLGEVELELFTEKLMYLAQGAQVVVLAGSLPRGAAPEVYGRLVRELRKRGLTTIVDTDGEPLRQAVRAEPSVVSPNVLEAEELVGHEFNDDEDRVIAVREMVQLGAEEAIMTVGDGCFAQVLVEGAPRLYRVRVESRPARSTIGSGDAFLAGYVASRYARSGAEQCLRFAVACGAESTEHLGAGILDPTKVERVMAEVELEVLEQPAEVS